MKRTSIDRKEVEETYQQFYPVIKGKCMRMLQNSADAQDLAQETFTRLWENRRSLKNADAKLTWIYKTATRLAVDQIRRNSRAANYLIDEFSDHRIPSSQTESRDHLTKILQKIPSRELEAIILSRVDGLRHEEIGSVMGISDRSVRRLMNKAKQRLQQIGGDSR